ncbi:MAG TPA: HlyD family efflux transporter periplasmic adaptor subunit [Novosphingobium sp.]|nr:HlyD family efflux transporter periplasmic adaptor subunit [Novosphingobium sp.]
MSDDAQALPAENGHEHDETSVVDEKKRRPLLIGLAAAVVAVAALYVLYDVFIGSRSVSTDNAYVSGDTAEVTPLTSGKVVEVLVTDTQPVRKGQLLFRLDDSDQKIALAQAEAGLVMAQRRYRQSLANNEALGATAEASASEINSARARLTSAEASLGRAQAEYDRRAALAGSGAVSAEELTTAREALKSAEAAARDAQASVAQARSTATSAREQQRASLALTDGTTSETAPEVRLAKARMAQAKLDLERTIVRAPMDGVVAKRAVQVGQKIEAGSPAMSIVPIGQLYVNANFKEDQLGKVHSGQKATLISDFYGADVVYHGKVVGFSGGTGAAFSLIPAQNATGNWIKVVQRLPVRIELDAKELKDHPLRIGLSMDAKIDLTDGR